MSGSYVYNLWSFFDSDEFLNTFGISILQFIKSFSFYRYLLATRAQLQLAKEFTKPCIIQIPRNKRLDSILIQCSKRITARRSTVAGDRNAAKNIFPKKKTLPFSLSGRRHFEKSSNGNGESIALEPLVDVQCPAIRHRPIDNHTALQMAGFCGLNTDVAKNLAKCIPFTDVAMKAKKTFPRLLRIPRPCILRRACVQPLSTADFIIQCLKSYELVIKPSTDRSLVADGIGCESDEFGKLNYLSNSN